MNFYVAGMAQKDLENSLNQYQYVDQCMGAYDHKQFDSAIRSPIKAYIMELIATLVFDKIEIPNFNGQAKAKLLEFIRNKKWTGQLFNKQKKLDWRWREPLATFTWEETERSGAFDTTLSNTIYNAVCFITSLKLVGLSF